MNSREIHKLTCVGSAVGLVIPRKILERHKLERGMKFRICYNAIEKKIVGTLVDEGKAVNEKYKKTSTTHQKSRRNNKTDGEWRYCIGCGKKFIYNSSDQYFCCFQHKKIYHSAAWKKYYRKHKLYFMLRDSHRSKNHIGKHNKKADKKRECLKKQILELMVNDNPNV